MPAWTRRPLADEAAPEDEDAVTARARCLNVLGGVAYFRGDYAAGEAAQQAAATALLDAGQLAAAAGLLGNRALTRSAQARLPEAMADLHEALRLLTQVGDGRQHAFQQQRLGALYARAGDFERAQDLLHEARDVLARADAPSWQAECETELARLYLEWAPPGAPRPRGCTPAPPRAWQASLGRAPTCVTPCLPWPGPRPRTATPNGPRRPPPTSRGRRRGAASGRRLRAVGPGACTGGGRGPGRRPGLLRGGSGPPARRPD
ncbi:hypothetical protein [Deinococcus multiflagellatus]|uniref:Tetratricopeptide repeat protein n=1 Tax=Deinococcus multiflagellatus TaxID=1656887 RepID=A0ABW1ZHH8_9DEIO